jgi:anthranilate/para-aminobenzoate synthase component II
MQSSFLQERACKIQKFVSSSPFKDTGNLNNLFEHSLLDDIPVLGVCLGHQLIGYFCGSEISQASQIMHGRTSEITVHKDSYLFDDIPKVFHAVRYHSWIVKPVHPLETIAYSIDDNIQVCMALLHTAKPWSGVQFHPEVT